jgi:endonuclease IV
MLASGFDIATSHTELVAILDEFENDIGEPPAFFHLNDSEGALGSNRDRHALIGEGQIGIEAFDWLLSDHRSKNVPLILETPQANPDIADDDDSPDSNDLLCMERLKALAGWSR